MSTTTTNYKLHKPELTDAADITKMNPNWDVVDEKLFNALKSVSTYYNSSSGTNMADTATNTTMLVVTSTSNNAELFKALGSKDDFAYIQQYFFGEISESSQRLQIAQGRLSGNITVRSKLYDGTWTAWSKIYSNNNKPTADDLPVIPVEKGGTGATYWKGALDSIRAMERLATYYSTTSEPDIDTITDGLMLIPIEHSKNCPVGGGFIYVMQLFYGDVTATNNRTQIAFPYSIDGTIGNGIAIRAYYNGTWTGWQKISEDHNHSAGKITGGTLGGMTVANKEYTKEISIPQIRNSYAGTFDMVDGETPLTTGEIYYYYEE